MNTLKKTTLVLSLLIPANGLFAGFSDWLNPIKNGAQRAWNYTKTNTQNAWKNCTKENAKDALNYASEKTQAAAQATYASVKNHPKAAAASAITVATVAALVTKYKNQIAKFGKDQQANIFNKYSDLKEKCPNLKEKYNKLDADKKSKIKKATIATAAVTGAAVGGYALYRIFKK